MPCFLFYLNRLRHPLSVLSILIICCTAASSCSNRQASPPPEADSTLLQSSGVPSIQLSPEKTKVLTDLGMLWGFLKYYHPTVAKGTFNWDKALFNILPGILRSSSPQEAYRLMEAWTDRLGMVPETPAADTAKLHRVKTAADYGYLFVPGNLPASLVKKLASIRDNYRPLQKHHYVDFSSSGNPVFINEIPYDHSPYPDAGVRLLALYRYWNIIQYFFPYRHLIKEDWNKVLSGSIPDFVNAGNKNEYMLAFLRLIAKIEDTHASVWDANTTLDSLKGMLIAPFRAQFIEGKLVVTGYYAEQPEVKAAVQPGDIIERIDHAAIDTLVKRALPLTSASNYERKLHDIRSSRGFLLRSNNPFITVSVRHDSVLKEIKLKRIPVTDPMYTMDYSGGRGADGYQLLPDSIGYIYAGKLKEKDINTIRQLFRGTKGLIVDLRCYPSTFMPLIYGAWLKSESTPFALLTQNNLEMPGSTRYITTVSNGGGDGVTNGYDGKLVIIVNVTTLSQAEYTAMALASVPGAVVIGSQTAAADGNVSNIPLPGGITTMISGLGVYYPDSTETQQKGVKIDIPLQPTIQGIRNNRDELLEKAVRLISDSLSSTGN